MAGPYRPSDGPQTGRKGGRTQGSARRFESTTQPQMRATSAKAARSLMEETLNDRSDLWTVTNGHTDQPRSRQRKSGPESSHHPRFSLAAERVDQLTYARSAPDSQQSVHRLSRDEQRCLVLCDLAHSVWEKMKDDVDMAWPTFRSVYEQLNDTTVRKSHDFRSVQMCLLTTYAMKVPVLAATCNDEGGADVVFLAISCFDDRLDDFLRCAPAISSIESRQRDVVVNDNINSVESLQSDLVGHVERHVRVVICGEDSGAVFAQRLTAKVLKAVHDTSRVMCISVGCRTRNPEFMTEANHFTSLTSSVNCSDIDFSEAPMYSLYPCEPTEAGDHFVVIVGRDGNLELRACTLLESVSQTRMSSQWKANGRDFTSNLRLYLAASPRTAAVKRPEAAASCPAVPVQDKPCILCSEICGLFHVSAAGRQIDAANMEVLRRALEYICMSVLQRHKQQASASSQSDDLDCDRDYKAVSALLEDEHIFKLLEGLANLTVQEFEDGERVAGGNILRKSICALLPSRRGLAKVLRDEQVTKLLTKMMKVSTSALQCKLKPKERAAEPPYASGGATGAAGKAFLGFAAVRAVATAGIAGCVAAAAPYLLGAGLIGGVVAAGVKIHQFVMEEEMSWEDRDKRYRGILRLFLATSLSADNDGRWSRLSALQLEALLAKKVRDDIRVTDIGQGGVPACFREITKDSVQAAIKRIYMAKMLYKLRCSLTQTCHIALVGHQNAGKSTMVKEVWQQRNVPNIGVRKHTTETGIYIIADKIRVLDFPGTTSQSQSVQEEFSRLSAMAGIVIFLAKYDGSPNTDTINQYGHVKKSAGKKPILVCLTQVSRCWDDDGDEDEDDEEEGDSAWETLRSTWAESLGCSSENILLTELKKRSEEMKQCGIAGCDEIRCWLKRQLLRMEIYSAEDKMLDVAVGRMQL